MSGASTVLIVPQGPQPGWDSGVDRGPRSAVGTYPEPVLPTPYAEEVLDLVARIPPGRVMSYADVARRLGHGGPRQVGAALRRFGSGVPWHRVVRSDGSPAPHLAAEAIPLLKAERTAMTASGDRVDLTKARWL
jgi:alkylated DNA nucleotide flippase Atl1